MGNKKPSPPNHMAIQWHDYVQQEGEQSILTASLTAKASVVGRTGLMLLACGTGAWRVRSSMNAMAAKLGLVCAADIGLTSLEYTCFDGEAGFSQTLTLTSTGVNTAKLNRLERFVEEFSMSDGSLSGEDLHIRLDEIEALHGLYSTRRLAMAAALACGAFTFLLGGGPVEIALAFLGAGIGNSVRSMLTKRKYTLFLCVALSVGAACLVYAGCLKGAELLFEVDPRHEAGYICAMLFIIPGFPFITSGIDLAKQDMRSGLERLAYAVMIVLVAALAAWLMALLLGLTPVDFPPLDLSEGAKMLFRLIASFCGVFGFSLMFNSPIPLAAAAFLGALTAGLLASAWKGWVGYPRIAITVPSIVIMVPGLYFYRAVYNLGIMDLTTSASWMASALLIVLALPLGLIFARIMTDRRFRYST